MPEQSDKEKLEYKITKDLDKLKREIMYFHDKDIDFARALSSWLLEVGIKNRIIHNTRHATDQKDKEIVRRRRRMVYYIDLGVGIGAELNYPHFCVVVKEFTHTAIIIPISSVKDVYQPWKTESDAYIEIGKIKGLNNPDTPDSYAVIGAIQTVSKQRLSYYKDQNGVYIKTLHLDDDQMSKIDDAIKEITTKNTETQIKKDE